MVNVRATGKACPLVICSLSTGAVHVYLMHTYGTEAFLLQWGNFTALRGCPKQVWSDKGSQLTSSANYVTWSEAEDPSKWQRESIKFTAARQNTEWKFVPSGCQFRNGLVESRVRILKQTLLHVMHGTLIHDKPTASYAEVQTFLSRAANNCNDRLLGVRLQTEDDFIPITPNQLLIGKTSTSSKAYDDKDVENFQSRCKYVRELLDLCWKMWFNQVFPSLLPYDRYKGTKQYRNLKTGDICLLKYDGKVCGSYRFCRVEDVKPDQNCDVRTVVIAMRPQNRIES